jgi:excisionase family DNA binding protein
MATSNLSGKATVYSMAQRGELPALKVRGQWRIRKVDFDRWLEQRAQAATSSKPRKGRS